MSRAREQYIPPVGFAREPHVERRRWIGRVLLLLLIAFLLWMLIYKVISPPNPDVNTVPQEQLGDF